MTQLDGRAVIGQPVHLMTIDMGNFCGQPSTGPSGGRASSVLAEVTCDACADAFAKVVAETNEICQIGERAARCADPDCDGDAGHDGPHYQWVPE